MTGNELIASSLRLIGALASGETPSGAEGADGLVILNQMIDEWNSERLSVFAQTIHEFTLVANQQLYTMGKDGSPDFDVVRPARIERASIVQLSNPSQPLELPIRILNEQGWQAIPVKDITSTLPQVVYIDDAFPNRNLRYWQTPSIEVKTRLYAWTPLAAFTLAGDKTLPPAYLKAIRYNLAVDLAPEFGRTTPVEVAVQAAESKGKLKSLNTPKYEMSVDPALRGDSGGGQYNWRSDTSAGGR